jgi:hypothetical protein
MSRHISRKQRWTEETPQRYSSADGKVFYERGAWYGTLEYRTRVPEDGRLAAWEAHTLRLGPFKRPRNAMVAVEQEATILRNRHGENVLFSGQLWADATGGS